MGGTPYLNWGYDFQVSYPFKITYKMDNCEVIALAGNTNLLNIQGDNVIPVRRNSTDKPLLTILEGKLKDETNEEKKYDVKELRSSRLSSLQYHILKLKTEKKKENILRYWGFYLSTLFAIFNLAGSVLLYSTDTFEAGIQKLITLSEGSYIYNLWKDPQLDILVYIYPFNYTNLEEVLAGKEKPIVKELGPYVFRQSSLKSNVEFNGVETLTYSENITNTFMSELTNGNLDNVVVTPNIGMFTALSSIRNLSMIAQFSASTFLRNVNTKEFVNITVRKFLFGYDDEFSTLVRNVMNYIDNEIPLSLGVLANRDGLISDRITIGTGIPHLNKIGIIKEYNGKDRIEDWFGDECNNLTASDGYLYPAEVVKRHETVYVYRRMFCRRLPFIYEKDTITQQGYPAKRYILPADVYSSSHINPHNKCFCKVESCLPSGVISIAPCYYDAPVVLSNPHFLYGEKQLIDNIIGLKPDPEKHNTFVDIHEVGAPIEGIARFQVGIITRKARYSPFLKGLKEDTVLPIVWVSLHSTNLTGTPEFLMHHVTYTAPLIKQIAQLCFAILFIVFFTRLIMYIFLKM